MHAAAATPDAPGAEKEPAADSQAENDAGKDADAPRTPDTPLPPESATPMSDKEETGELIGALPERVELMDLPAEEDMELTATERALRDAGTLFPAALWPVAPVLLPESADPSGFVATGDSAPPASEPLSPEVIGSSFGPGPPPPLHDPHGLITPSQAAPLLAMLRDSLNLRGSFLTNVVVLKPSEQLPVTLNPQDLLQRWHGNNKGLLVLYFFGQPGRTQAFFTPETRLHHRSEDLRQIIDFGVREAARLTAPLPQLQRFCYKTAVRLDRLHRQGIMALSDDTAVAGAASFPVTGLWWAFAVGVQAAALAAGAVWWLRRHRIVPAVRGGKVIRLPDQDLISRLGAPHSGGFGAVIQFGVPGQRL
jgi:hypothetical protein